MHNSNSCTACLPQRNKITVTKSFLKKVVQYIIETEYESYIEFCSVGIGGRKIDHIYYYAQKLRKEMRK